MPKRDDSQLELLQGTLDMLILRTLAPGPAHGHRIAHSIERSSGDELLVDHGSLYPALQRLERRGWISAEWGTSENNRRAKYYRLTVLGQRQLAAATARWERLAAAIARVLGPADGVR
jgi:PadR family transcriptional regulator, regulatory protein PadR